MNRRRFLSMLSAGAFGAMTLDVDKLLWVPGEKTIFLPPKSVLTVDMIHHDALAMLTKAMKAVADKFDYDFLMAYRSDIGLG